MSTDQEHPPPRPPTEGTLAKYGLTLEEWWSYIPYDEEQQAYVCVVCERPPRTGRFVVDHRHVPRYSALPDMERKRYVRGVICTTCNHYILTRYGTPLKHRNAAKYLEEFERRFNSEHGNS